VETAVTQDGPEGDDTPLTDALLDQFATYYLLAVLAVRALEEARRHAATASERA
jgi:hypothetical protein|tara:strand:- start:776 stop:937 length:162 start_codon:yes stop_codon:yes gene_type:complete